MRLILDSSIHEFDTAVIGDTHSFVTELFSDNWLPDKDGLDLAMVQIEKIEDNCSAKDMLISSIYGIDIPSSAIIKKAMEYLFNVQDGKYYEQCIKLHNAANIGIKREEGHLTKVSTSSAGVLTSSLYATYLVFDKDSTFRDAFDELAEKGRLETADLDLVVNVYCNGDIEVLRFEKGKLV